MANSRPTYDQFRAVIPAMSLPDITEEPYNSYAPEADLYVPRSRSYPTGFYSQLYIWCIAHLPWEYQSLLKGDDTSDAGAITMARIDKIQVKYQQSTVTNELESFFAQSRYGRRFINLIYVLRRRQPRTLLSVV